MHMLWFSHCGDEKEDRRIGGVQTHELICLLACLLSSLSLSPRLSLHTHIHTYLFFLLFSSVFLSSRSSISLSLSLSLSSSSFRHHGRLSAAHDATPLDLTAVHVVFQRVGEGQARPKGEERRQEENTGSQASLRHANHPKISLAGTFNVLPLLTISPSCPCETYPLAQRAP